MLNDHLRPGPDCIALIQQFEGFSSKPYLCPANVPTIGYGSTQYQDGRAVSLKDPAITQEQAMWLMVNTLEPYAAAVRRGVDDYELSQPKFDALTSFVYNVGAEKFKNSTLLVLLNRGDVVGAADQFGRWTKASGQVLPGLVKRRAAERRLFMQGV